MNKCEHDQRFGTRLMRVAREGRVSGRPRPERASALLDHHDHVGAGRSLNTEDPMTACAMTHDGRFTANDGASAPMSVACAPQALIGTAGAVIGRAAAVIRHMSPDA
jgi:hypothetical protein